MARNQIPLHVNFPPQPANVCKVRPGQEPCGCHRDDTNRAVWFRDFQWQTPIISPIYMYKPAAGGAPKSENTRSLNERILRRNPQAVHDTLCLGLSLRCGCSDQHQQLRKSPRMNGCFVTNALCRKPPNLSQVNVLQCAGRKEYRLQSERTLSTSIACLAAMCTRDQCETFVYT